MGMQLAPQKNEGTFFTLIGAKKHNYEKLMIGAVAKMKQVVKV